MNNIKYQSIGKGVINTITILKICKIFTKAYKILSLKSLILKSELSICLYYYSNQHNLNSKDVPNLNTNGIFDKFKASIIFLGK